MALAAVCCGFSALGEAQAKDPLLDEPVGFNGEVLFLESKVPGLVIGAVRKGEMSIAGFGKRSDDAGEPPGADTVMRKQQGGNRHLRLAGAKPRPSRLAETQ